MAREKIFTWVSMQARAHKHTQDIGAHITSTLTKQGSAQGRNKQQGPKTRTQEFANDKEDYIEKEESDIKGAWKSTSLSHVKANC